MMFIDATMEKKMSGYIGLKEDIHMNAYKSIYKTLDDD